MGKAYVNPDPVIPKVRPDFHKRNYADPEGRTLKSEGRAALARHLLLLKSEVGAPEPKPRRELKRYDWAAHDEARKHKKRCITRDEQIREDLPEGHVILSDVARALNVHADTVALHVTKKRFKMVGFKAGAQKVFCITLEEQARYVKWFHSQYVVVG